MYYKLLISTLFLIFVKIDGGVVDATIKSVRADMFGMNYYYQILEAKFDEEFYQLEQCACPCNNSCTAPTIDDEVNETNYDIIEIYEGHDWIYIYNTTQPHYFKFNVTKKFLSCPTIVVSVEAIVGSPSYTIDVGRIPDKSNCSWSNDVYGKGFNCLCGPLFRYGMYYVTVIPETFSLYSSFRVRYRELEPFACGVVPISPPPPYPSDDQYHWLTDSVPFYNTIDTDDIHAYRFFIPHRCANITASVMKLSPIGDVDIYMDLKSPYPQPKQSQWFSATDSDDNLAIALCTNSDNFTINIGIKTYFPGSTNYMVIATIREYNPRLLTDMAYTQYYYTVGYGYAYLTCPNFTMKCSYPQYTGCQFDKGNQFDCCHSLYPIPPTISPNPIFPWPIADNSLPIMDSIPWFPPLAIKPKKLTWAFYMGYTIAYPSQSFIKYENFPDLSLCQMHFNNKLLTSSGYAFMDVITFQPKKIHCDFDRYNNVTSDITDIITQMNYIDDFPTLSMLRVKIDSIYFDDSIDGCKNLTNTVLSSSPVYTTYHNFSTCLSDFEGSKQQLDDPCCNNQYILDKCCISRSITLHDDVLLNVDDTKVDLLQHVTSKECVKKRASDYCSKVNNQIQCSLKFLNTTNNDKRDSLKKFISSCRRKYIGEIGQGVPCDTNMDCYNETTCDPLTKICKFNESDVLRCYAEEIDGYVMRLLYINWMINEPSDNRDIFLTYLKDKILINACTGPDAIYYRKHYQYISIIPCKDNCIPIPVCYDTRCEVPSDCIYGEGTVCNRLWTLVLPQQSLCVNTRDCNWINCRDLGLSQDDCQQLCLNESLSNYTCINCGNDGNCVEVKGFSQSRCELGLCSIPGIISPETCISSSHCSIPCENCTKEKCESLVECSDTLNITSFMNTWNQSGVCITKLINNYNDIYCYDNTIFPYGCANKLYKNESQCIEDGKGFWRTPAYTEDSCKITINNSTLGVYSPSLNFFLRVPLEEAESCGLEIRPYVNWTKGVWTKGTVQKLSWVKREFQKTRKIAPTIDYMGFEEMVDKAIGELLSFSFITESLCRYEQTYKINTEIVCDLKNRHNCFSQNLTVYQSSAGIACPYLSNTINSNEATLYITPYSISPELNCQRVSLYFISANRFESQVTATLSSEIFLLKPANEFSIVQNNNKAIVGQIVTNGVGIQFQKKNFSFDIPVLLCIQHAKIKETPIYNIYGIGQLNNNTINVIDISNIIDMEYVCGYITRDGTYFGIKTVEDYELLLPYDKNTFIQAFVAIPFYGFLIVAAIIDIIILKLKGSKHVQLKIFVMGLVIISSSARIAYFVLFSTENLAGVTSVALFEVPTFLFFLQYLLILYLWLYVIQNSFKPAHTESSLPWYSYLVTNVFVALLFISFVSVFYALPESNTLLPCDFTTISNISWGRYETNLIYACIIAGLSVLLGILFICVGIKYLYDIYMYASGKSSKKFILMTVFVVFSYSTTFAARSVLLVYALVTLKTIYLILMVLLEFIPSLVLIFYVTPSDEEAKANRHRVKSVQSKYPYNPVEMSE